MSSLCKTEEIIVDTTEYNSDEAEENIRLTLEDSGGENYHSTSYHDHGLEHHDNNSSSPPHQRIQHITSGQHHNMTNLSTGKPVSKNVMENEKRMRREIANSNERRRMQSINAGFQSLRSLLPHHEGEKLSKAAILQQTAQYIIELERGKTQLLSQNSQLKRFLGQHELGNGGGGGGNTDGGGGGGGSDNIKNGGGNIIAIKKRKLADTVINVQTISDSSDEGLGSMSPEPVTLLNNTTKIITTTTSSVVGTNNNYITNNIDMNELKIRLESELKNRSVLEERVRQLERQIYPNQFIQREVIEHTDNIRDDDIPVTVMNDPLKLQVVEIDSLPAVGQTQVVVCSSLEELQEHEIDTEETITSETDLQEEVIIPDDSQEYVEVPSRLQPILEAAIKAEPKVEVERINATLTKIKDESSSSSSSDKKKIGGDIGNGNNQSGGGNSGNGRMYLTSTSRQNLETIVEAIRHLEGDHLFGDMTEQQKKAQKNLAQDVPLALTNKPQLIQQQQQQQQRKQLPAELKPFLQIKKSTTTTSTPTNVISNVTIIGATTPTTLGSITANIATNNSNINNNNNNNCNNSINSNSLKCTTNISNIINSNNCIATPSITNLVTVTGGTLKIHQKQQSLSSSGTTIIPIVQQQQQQQQPATLTISAATLKQCRPGVIVAKQIS